MQNFFFDNFFYGTSLDFFENFESQNFLFFKFSTQGEKRNGGGGVERNEYMHLVLWWRGTEVVGLRYEEESETKKGL